MGNINRIRDILTALTPMSAIMWTPSGPLPKPLVRLGPTIKIWLKHHLVRVRQPIPGLMWILLGLICQPFAQRVPLIPTLVVIQRVHVATQNRDIMSPSLDNTPSKHAHLAATILIGAPHRLEIASKHPPAIIHPPQGKQIKHPVLKELISRITTQLLA